MDDWSIPPGLIPRRLYRVDYEGTMSEYIPNRGFEAATFAFTNIEAEFLESVEDHLNWFSGVWSPYISLFSEKRHAENWARKWMANNGSRDCRVFEIDGKKLESAYLFHPYCLEIQFGDGCWGDEHEYLCLHFIPEDAIIGYWPA